MDQAPRHFRASRSHPARRTLLLAGAAATIMATKALTQQDQPIPDLRQSESSPASGNVGSDQETPSPQVAETSMQIGTAASRSPSRLEIVTSYAGRSPRYWGLEAPGVLTHLAAGSEGIALTVDVCGGPGGNDYDSALITALRDRHIPATLFLNSRWITANIETARQLAVDPLFELANHGTSHLPLSTAGKSAYGITGTQNPGKVYDEVMTNTSVLAQLTGISPRLFRPGTAYLDEVAANIVKALGMTPTGFSINADGGATYPAATVASETSKARSGDIIICHGNHPGSGTAEGLMRALDTIAARGLLFVHLD